MTRGTACSGWVLILAMAACGGKTEPPAGGAPGATPGQRINTGPPVDGNATLKSPATAVAGATIEVAWTGPGNSQDYIDIVPRGYAATSGELTYAYTPNAVPTAKLRVPTAGGEYEVRYIAALTGERKVKAVAPLTVTPATATVTAPAAAGGGEIMSIAWTGPNGNGDYIDIVPTGQAEANSQIAYAYTRDGTPVKVGAPGYAGTFDVRYVLEGPGGRKVLATAPVTVTMPVATLKAPDRVKRGETFVVEWTGPKRAGDYVDLVRKGHAEASGELAYFYVDREVLNAFKAPAEPGEFEVRYILQAPGARVVLARQPLIVQ